MHADRRLALRLEGAEAANSRAVLARIAELQPRAGVESFATCGGHAGFAGAGSFFSQLLHAGLDGPVARDDWTRMERFFRTRLTPIVVSLCPFADASLLEWLAKRRYRISHFENTLVTPLPSRFQESIAGGAAPPSETQAWARAVTRCFALGDNPPHADALVDLVAALGSSAGAAPLEIRMNGVTAAGGILSILGDTAILHCDATLDPFRGQGLQSLLIRERLRRAAEAGCDLAMACTVPGTTSQRNYERQGFRVAYTKTMLVKDWS
jgi:GNAT superfamily N-acetyltransferase